MEVLKITKLIEISDFIVIQKKLTLTTLKKAVAKYLGKFKENLHAEFYCP